MLISRLREEARVLADYAERADWEVRRSHQVSTATPLAFYGDTFTGPALIQRRLFELIEPEFDMLARLPWRWTRRVISFGPLEHLLDLGRPGFYKPADPATKWFDARVYSAQEQASLATARNIGLLAIHAEPVRWGAEFRAVVHNRRVVSLQCYAVDGRRMPNVLEPIELDADTVRQARCFCDDFLGDAEPLPPALVMDVGQVRGRGWAVVEFNPLWCSRFFGGINRAYLDALSDVVRTFGAIEEPWRRWAVRSRYPASGTAVSS